MEWTEYLRFLFALAFVLGLIGVAAWAIRRYGMAGPKLPRRNAASRRLAVQEMLVVDPRRRLLLVRRDDREHLVLLGIDGDCLLEAGIPLDPKRQSPAEEPS